MTTRAALGLATGVLLALAAAAPAAAQDAPSFVRKTTVSGYIDAYYSYNMNRPATPCGVVNGVAVFNCLHAFDVARNAFSLNLASLALEKAPTEDSRGGFRVDLGYGAGAELIAGAESGRRDASLYVRQAYLSYLAAGSRRLRVDVGKFVTPAGIETVEPSRDWNGSRSLLFSLAIPHDHVGVRAVYTPTDTVTVTGLLTNGWSDIADNGNARRLGASVSIRPVRALTVTETYLGGTETSVTTVGWRDLLDSSVTGRVTKKMSLAFNADLGRDRRTLQAWQGAAAYLRYEIRDWLAITPRVESLRDHDGFMTRVSQDLQEATATVELKHSQDTALRLEYRIDVADARYFLKSVSTTVKTQRIVSADWVFFFNSHGPGSPQPDDLPSAFRKQ